MADQQTNKIAGLGVRSKARGRLATSSHCRTMSVICRFKGG